MKQSIYHKLKQLEGHYFTQTHSAAGKWLNYKLISVEEGTIKASVEVRDEMCNPNKMLHGGMYAMIFDEILGLTFFSVGKPTFYTTINLHVDFLMSAPAGSQVIVEAKVLRVGKRAANVVGEMYAETGEHLAHASTNLINTDKEVFELEI